MIFKWNKVLLLEGEASSKHPGNLSSGSRKAWSVTSAESAALQNQMWKLATWWQMIHFKNGCVCVENA